MADEEEAEERDIFGIDYLLPPMDEEGRKKLEERRKREEEEKPKRWSREKEIEGSQERKRIKSENEAFMKAIKSSEESGKILGEYLKSREETPTVQSEPSLLGNLLQGASTAQTEPEILQPETGTPKKANREYSRQREYDRDAKETKKRKLKKLEEKKPNKSRKYFTLGNSILASILFGVLLIPAGLIYEKAREAGFKKKLYFMQRDLNGNGKSELFYTIEGKRYFYSVDGNSIENLLNESNGGLQEETAKFSRECVLHAGDLDGNGIPESFYVIDGRKYFSSVNGRDIEGLVEELREK